jgi:hypothetical protein
VARVSPSDAAIHGAPPRPRIRLFRPWRRHPVTAREWRAAAWHMSFHEGGRTRTLSTGTADLKRAQQIAQQREAELVERERKATPRQPGAGKQ